MVHNGTQHIFDVINKNGPLDYKKLKASAKALMSKPALEIPREYNPNLPPNDRLRIYSILFLKF